MKHFTVLVDKNENILREWQTDRRYKYCTDFFYEDTATDYSESNNLTDPRIERRFKYYKTESKKWLFWKKEFHFYKPF